MNKANSKISFFANIQNLIKENIKILIGFIICIIIIIVGYQIYFFNKDKKIRELSIFYFDAKKSESQMEFIENMNVIAKDNSFYGLMASLEIIHNMIENKNYNESFNEYLNLLNNKNIDNIYKTLLAIHASYNLLNKIDSKNIINLLSYVDVSLESFLGYRLEILYLLSITQGNINKTNSLYDEIINNNQISLSIKERVKKINGFEKYK